MARLRKTTATAPGKLILSGEHAVVYGQPALATAINTHTCTVLHDLPSCNAVIYMSLQGGQPPTPKSYSWEFIQRKAQHCWQQQQGSSNNSPAVQDVFELLQVIVAHTVTTLNLSLHADIHIAVQSDSPIGCGLGSSASLIVSVMQAIANHFGVQPAQSWYDQQATKLENLQHARSSGVDPYICLRGGCHLFQQGQARQVAPPTFPLMLVHTGRPSIGTGACVLQVKNRCGNSSIWSEFAQVTNSLCCALQQQDQHACQQAIRHNHQLLNSLGVVPKPVAQFIANVQQQGAAAKICGAGATQGQGGGMVWVLADHPSLVHRLCRNQGYSYLNAAAYMRPAHASTISLWQNQPSLYEE